ncbi:MAG: hypothetical protein R2857_14505 [Vampirovibrionales bacterium]
MRGPLVRIRVYTPQQPAAMAAVLDDFVTAHATSPAAAKLSQAEVRAMFMNLRLRLADLRGRGPVWLRGRGARCGPGSGPG